MAVKHYKNYLAGEWVDNDRIIEVINPATEELVGTIACVGEEEIQQAVEKARQCVESGVLTKPRPAIRSQMMYRVAQEIRALSTEIIPILVAENGKTQDEAVVEVENAARYFEYYAGMADKIEGKSIPLGEDYIDFTVYEPVGVSAQIVPWNYPVDICARSLAPALAAGCAVIVKSPELTPLAITLLGIACDRAGVPKGAVSILCGYGDEAGASLVSNKDVNQIVFTGSVATGKSILRAASENAIPCVMELGGKSAAVVFPDADIDNLLTSIDWGIFYNAGQVCSAMSRLLVHENIHDEVVARVKVLAEQQVLGSASNTEVTLTPVASKDQQNRIAAMCSEAISQGATLVAGGSAIEGDGFFMQPTVLNNVLPEMTVFNNEVFGPVISVTSFKTEEQAWDLANGTEFGLVAGVFTQDIGVALRATKQLEAGQIFVNEWFAGGIETPFGGLKLSGYGREKGQEALYSYVNTKNVAIKLN